eukprot:TRINITY_DN93410_c0_g1_i1.p1 TRINITY_DN93410_c0_g1~~TRINITY_DN93410_c0_g1_i1.p1  ORF type:complete len:482 (-),score=175.76 TRINITY_DN93410_c0_g1_i1:355-1800(-)
MLALVGTAVAVLVLVILIWKFTSGSSTKGKASNKKNQQKNKKAAAPKEEAKASKAATAKEEKAPEPAPAATGTAPEKEQTTKKASAKGASKAKAKGKKNEKPAAPVKEAVQEEEAPKKVFDGPPTVVDDGNAGDEWEVATALPKKVAARQARIAEEKEMARQAALAAKRAQGGPAGAANRIPGMGPAEPTKAVGKAKAKDAAKEATKAMEKEDDKGMESRPVKVPEAKIGHIIGPKGATLKLIQEKCGLTKIDTSENVFVLMGPSKACTMAENAIKELVEKGFTSLSYEDFSQASVQVHPSMFPELIGKQGAVIKKFKEELQVEVGMPQTPPDAIKFKKKYTVTLAGSNANVAKAKEAINEILKFYHSEVTHPGIVHEEVEIEPWQLQWVIGPKGSEIRHIQNNFHVKLYLAGENSVNPAHILVGEPADVKRANAYIEKLLWSDTNASGREAATGKYDGDGWEGEEEVEDWMQGYLYKRKK